MTIGTAFNSLLGFSSFESSLPEFELHGSQHTLSIPYWDFLVLNHAVILTAPVQDVLNFQFPIGIF